MYMIRTAAAAERITLNQLCGGELVNTGAVAMLYCLRFMYCLYCLCLYDLHCTCARAACRTTSLRLIMMRGASGMWAPLLLTGASRGRMWKWQQTCTAAGACGRGTRCTGIQTRRNSSSKSKQIQQQQQHKVAGWGQQLQLQLQEWDYSWLEGCMMQMVVPPPLLQLLLPPPPRLVVVMALVTRMLPG